MSGEIAGIGMIFVGIGITYLLYQLGRFYKTSADLEERYALVQIATLNKTAKKKNIDLDKEKQKLRTLNMMEKKRSFRKSLEEEIINDFFKNTDGKTEVINLKKK